MLINFLKRDYIFLILLIFFILIYFAYPLADPPAKQMYCFGVYLTDEGFRTLASKDRLVSNRDFETISLLNKDVSFFPIVYFIYYLTFKIFGVGFLQARSISILFGIFSLFIFLLIVRKMFPKNIAILCFYLFGINHIFIFYSKLALAESFLVFFSLLSIYLYIISSNKKLLIILSGIFSGLTIFIKPQSLPFVISVFLLCFDNLKNNLKESIIRIFSFLSGLIISFLFVFLLIFITKSGSLFFTGTSGDIYVRITLFTKEIIYNIYSFPQFNVNSQSPIQFYLGICFIFIVLLKIIKNIQINLWEKFSLFFIFFNSSMISIFRYQPMRYYIIMIPIIVIGFGILINEKYTLFLKNIYIKLFLFFITGYFIILNSFWISNYHLLNSSLGRTKQNIILSIIISILLVGIIFVLQRDYWKKFRKINFFILIFISFIFILFITNLTFRDLPYLFIEKIGVNSATFYNIFVFLYPLFLCILIIPFILILYSEYEERKNNLNFSRLNKFLIIVLLISSIFDLFHYLRWLKEKEYTLFNTSKEIVKITGNNCVIFGRAAPTLSIGNKFLASSNVHLLPDYILFFKNKNIPIYLLFHNWKEYGMFIKTYYNFLYFYGVKNYIFIKEFKVLKNYDKYSNLILFYVSFY